MAPRNIINYNSLFKDFLLFGLICYVYGKFMNSVILVIGYFLIFNVFPYILNYIICKLYYEDDIVKFYNTKDNLINKLNDSEIKTDYQEIKVHLDEFKNSKRIAFANQRLKNNNGTFRFIVICWLIILSCVVTMHHFKIINLEEEVVKIKSDIQNIWVKIKNLELKVDDVMTEIKDFATKIDQTIEIKAVRPIDDIYSKLLSQNPWMKTIDDNFLKIFSFFAGDHKARQFFQLGCFLEGTQIQRDAFGNTINVEYVKDGMYVWNHELNMKIRVRNSLAGNENGIIYKFKLSDGLEITVTDTHPMKIMKDGQYINVAAKNVIIGDITESINYKQTIIEIQQIPANGVMVYNFEFDIPEESPINNRILIANGIHTYDYIAQKQNK